MNKLTLPTILAATIMIAGAFAFMPVQDASTVHTTIQDSQMQLVRIASTVCTVVDAEGDGDCNITASITAGVPYKLHSIEIQVVLGADVAGDTIDYGVLTLSRILTLPADPANQTTSTNVITELSTGGVVGVGTGAGTITATPVIAGMDANDTETIQYWLTFEVPGTETPVLTFTA